MTKKDYELFANEINESVKAGLPYTQTLEICKAVFAKDNPLFQAEKFERACLEGKHIRQSIKNA